MSNYYLRINQDHHSVIKLTVIDDDTDDYEETIAQYRIDDGKIFINPDLIRPYLPIALSGMVLGARNNGLNCIYIGPLCITLENICDHCGGMRGCYEITEDDLNE